MPKLLSEIDIESLKESNKTIKCPCCKVKKYVDIKRCGESARKENRGKYFWCCTNMDCKDEKPNLFKWVKIPTHMGMDEDDEEGSNIDRDDDEPKKNNKRKRDGDDDNNPKKIQKNVFTIEEAKEYILLKSREVEFMGKCVDIVNAYSENISFKKKEDTTDESVDRDLNKSS